MAAIDDSQSFESPAAWKLKSFRRSVVGVSSSVSASWFKLRTVLVGENSSSSKVRTVEAGETASILGRVDGVWMRCAPSELYLKGVVAHRSRLDHPAAGWARSCGLFVVQLGRGARG